MSKPKEKTPLWKLLTQMSAFSAVAVIPLTGMIGLALPDSIQVFAFFVLLAIPVVLLFAGLGLGVTEVLALRKRRAQPSESTEAVPAASVEVSPT